MRYARPTLSPTRTDVDHAACCALLMQVLGCWTPPLDP